MANLIMICGPQAVGKMTVAESLRDKIRYNLMINHDSIEISDRIFGFATPAQKEFNALFRQKAFETAVKHDVDLIFTYVCAFEMPKERAYLSALADMFISRGGNFYFVELYSDIETRLERNNTPHRLEKKPSKRDLEWSRADILRSAQKHISNLGPDTFWFENHIKIDNSRLAPEAVADIIVEKFHLAANQREAREYRYGIE